MDLDRANLNHTIFDVWTFLCCFDRGIKTLGLDFEDTPDHFPALGIRPVGDGEQKTLVIEGANLMEGFAQ